MSSSIDPSMSITQMNQEYNALGFGLPPPPELTESSSVSSSSASSSSAPVTEAELEQYYFEQDMIDVDENLENQQNNIFGGSSLGGYGSDYADEYEDPYSNPYSSGGDNQANVLYEEIEMLGLLEQENNALNPTPSSTTTVQPQSNVSTPTAGTQLNPQAYAQLMKIEATEQEEFEII